MTSAFKRKVGEDGGGWRGRKGKMSEQRRKSDDRTISHFHGYWFTGTGWKFGRKSSRAAVMWMRPQRSRLSFIHVCFCLSAHICLSYSDDDDDDDVSASSRHALVLESSEWMDFIVIWTKSHFRKSCIWFHKNCVSETLFFQMLITGLLTIREAELSNSGTYSLSLLQTCFWRFSPSTICTEWTHWTAGEMNVKLQRFFWTKGKTNFIP